MMCRDMAEELAHFDLQKEKELKQVLLEYTAAQLERHEKVWSGWLYSVCVCGWVDGCVSVGVSVGVCVCGCVVCGYEDDYYAY